jgi:hypothetical protein
MATQEGHSEGTAATLGSETPFWQDPAYASVMQDETIDARP